MVIPVFDLISTAWPIQPDNLQWRYGFLGLLANVLLTPLMGAALAALAAASLRQRGLLKTLSFVYLAVTLGLGAAAALFALDVMQLGPQVNAASITNYRAGAAIAGGKYVLSMAGLGWLGVSGLRTARLLATGGFRD